MQADAPPYGQAGRRPALPGRMDSRFRGNDELKMAVGAGGLSSLAVNLSHMLFRPEIPVFCAVNVRVGRHVMQLTGLLCVRARRVRMACPPGMVPAHSRTLQPLGDQRLARRLHHPRANGQMSCLRLGMAHPVPRRAAARSGCGSRASPGGPAGRGSRPSRRFLPGKSTGADPVPTPGRRCPGDTGRRTPADRGRNAPVQDLA